MQEVRREEIVREEDICVEFARQQERDIDFRDCVTPRWNEEYIKKALQGISEHEKIAKILVSGPPAMNELIDRTLKPPYSQIFSQPANAWQEEFSPASIEIS